MMPAMTLTAIIVDDEPLARSLLAAILADIGQVDIVAMCENGFEAIEAVSAYNPDVMFLDIEMPQMNGFGVIKAIQADILPEIIFTTAYAQYAVEAFEVKALNYVLKPLDDDKIRESVERVKNVLGTGVNPPLKSEILTALSSPDILSKGRSLIVKGNDKIAFLDKEDIDWIEADGDYVCIHKDTHTHLVRATLKSVEAELHAPYFQRIHRSTIINLNHVREIISAQKGEAVVVMKAGERLKVSRTYGAALRAKLK